MRVCMPLRGRATARNWGATCGILRRGSGPCEAVEAMGRCARVGGWSRALVATPVGTGLDLIPCGSVLPLRRSRPHGRGRCPWCSWRFAWLNARSSRRAPSRLSHPNWRRSTGTRRGARWELKPMMSPSPRVTIRHRCAALGLPPSTEPPWPTGEPRVAAPPSRGKRPRSMGAHALSWWRAGGARSCASMHPRGRR
jgi:hypothetical protein